MRPRNRWAVIAVFFLFMLLHQADKLLIGPLTTPIMDEFGINEAQMGAVFTGALIVGAICFPLWGYLYDRFARAKLLALASFIWGSTTWLSALAPRFPLFVASRASTGIDDSSYPGLYSLAADYFEPKIRGKVYGLLQIAMPLGYMLGLVLATFLGQSLGWRRLYVVTGSLGVVLALVILLVVKEMPRGQAEPELAGKDQIVSYRFNLRNAVKLLQKKSWVLLLVQGFFGVIPWNVLTYWAFRFLETERGYDTGQATMVMAITVLTLAAGYYVGGALGDLAFKRLQYGRIVVSAGGVLMGAILLVLALNVPTDQPTLFMALLGLTGLFMPLAAPNVTATVHDITAPELRSTALAVQNFVEQGGSAVAPLIAGLIAVRSSLRSAILITCIGTWLLCAILFVLVIRHLPRDLESLRQLMRERGRQSLDLQAAPAQAGE